MGFLSANALNENINKLITIEIFSNYLREIFISRCLISVVIHINHFHTRNQLSF